jgi:hypothetical protein
MQRLNAGALGLALGIIWGVGVLAVVVANRITGSYGANWIVTLASLYPGLSLTPVGAVIGFLWGFVDGVICGVLVGWIYNGLLPRSAPASATPLAP